MADPSSDSAVTSKHARKPTVVIPALPRGFPDRRSKSLSQTASRDANAAFQAPASPVNAASEQITPSVDIHAHQAQDPTHSPPTQASTPINGLDEERDLQADATRGGGHVLDQEHEDSAETATLSNGRATEALLDHSVVTVTQVQDVPQTNFDPPHDVGQETAAAAGGRRVRLAEDETQSSEQDESDQQLSSATGLTDYAGSVAESNLETVVDETQRPPRLPAMPHRKSEIAPEVLTNGFSAHSAHDNHVSHVVDGSMSSHLPAQPEPAVLFSMQDHLLFLASSKSFYDTVIQVNQVDPSYQPSQHYAHSLILYRSEFMAKLIPESDPATQARVISLHPARNVLPHAFEAALRFFYSDQVLTAQGLVPQINYQDKHVKAQTLDYLMSYWVAGIELGLAPIKARSFDMVKDLVDWDVAELVAKEAQDLRARAEALADLSIQEEVREVAKMLSHMVSQLIVDRIKLGDFVLDVNAQVTVLPTRFAQLEYSRSNNPALTGMVFGSLPSNATLSPSTMSLASGLMLNMDFADMLVLATTLAAHGTRYGENLMRDVVQQREERRAHVVSSKSIPNKQRLGDSEKWNAAGWKEYMDEYGRLERERVGYLLPPRSR